MQETNENRGKKRPFEVGGYTVLPDRSKKKVEEVTRRLPDWLACPDVVEADIENEKKLLSNVRHHLCDSLVQKLKDNGITHFFPVQWQVIPAILGSLMPGSVMSRANLPPRDICCSAPTGSGKTLAFVLPIVQALQPRVLRKIRALVVLPVSDLALQVYKVFLMYTTSTNLKVGLTIGQSSLSAEQASIIKPCRYNPEKYDSTVDILVTTPGRLVDHINHTKGFDLSQLRFLVLDEVDRILEEIKQDWLTCLEAAVYANRGHPQPITVHSTERLQLPLQKLLFSATLTENPEKLEKLNLCQPRLFTSINNRHHQAPATTRQQQTPATDTQQQTPATDTQQQVAVQSESDETPSKKARVKPQEGVFSGKYTTPSSLQEFYVECRVSTHKPLILLHLLYSLSLDRVLVFTGSQDTASRLKKLLENYSDELKVELLSGSMNKKKRTQVLRQFSRGNIKVLVTTDLMTRGIDVEDISAVISYDSPPYLETYVHRAGRTARAGKPGLAYTILHTKEVSYFRSMIKPASKSIKAHKVSRGDIKPCLSKCQHILSESFS